MGKCNKVLCGIIVIAIGASVVLALCLPTAWLVAILAVVLIWAGIKLMCR